MRRAKANTNKTADFDNAANGCNKFRHGGVVRAERVSPRLYVRFAIKHGFSHSEHKPRAFVTDGRSFSEVANLVD
jgi:hypothetical protein